jgi:predicted nucleotide-binding protein
VAKINPDLFKRLRTKLGLSQPRIYALIDEKVRETHLPRQLAAIALASEHGINISKFAGEADLAVIRQTARAAAPPPVIAPVDQPRAAQRRSSRLSGRRPPTANPRRGKSVFVVHGRNESARRSVFEYLRSLGLQPIEWTQAIKRTGQGSPYIGDILETAFREAAAVVVLFTPDDEARLRKEHIKPRDPPYEKRLTGQPRANVLFEAGMAFGRNANSTVIVEIGDLRPFSDVAGRHAVHLSNDPTSRQEFATKLANAGCNVDTSGTDWLTAGDFDL